MNLEFEVSDEQIMERALRAYWMMAKKDGCNAPIPSNYHSGRSGVEEANDHRYAVLRNCNGILAAYRVRTNGVLKRLARWPSCL